MNTAPLTCVAAALWVTVASVTATSAQEAEVPVVVTSGEGLVSVVPDQAYVTVVAESRATSPKRAQEQTAKAMMDVHQQLKDARIPDDAVKTTGYGLQPEFDYREGKQILRGYVARNTIEVRIDEIERVGEVLDLVVGAGATSLQGVRFDVKDRAALEREALQRAVADARAKADAAATGAGMTVDRVVRIQEQGTIVPSPRPVMMARLGDMAEAAQTPIAAGELEIRVHVSLTAALR